MEAPTIRPYNYQPNMYRTPVGTVLPLTPPNQQSSHNTHHNPVNHTRHAPIHKREPFSPTISSKQIEQKPSNNGYKKVVMVAILALFAMLIFSSTAYSLTDHILAGFNIDLFGSDGEPSISATAFHTILYMMIALLVVTLFGR